MAKKQTLNASASRLKKQAFTQLAITPRNYWMMAGAALVIVVGFLLMTGAPTTEQQWNPDIFSSRRIVVGPTVAFIGYTLMGVAIMWKTGKQNDSDK